MTPGVAAQLQKGGPNAAGTLQANDRQQASRLGSSSENTFIGQGQVDVHLEEGFSGPDAGRHDAAAGPRGVFGDCCAGAGTGAHLVSAARRQRGGAGYICLCLW